VAPIPARWEHFEHGRCVGVRGLAATKAGAFEQAALALTALVCAPHTVRPLESVEISCTGIDDAALLASWLTALAREMAARHVVFGRFEVTISGGRLRGQAFGEPASVERHASAADVDGAVFLGARVSRTGDGGWMADSVVDL
jgi:SHS2 domain-containing protein